MSESSKLGSYDGSWGGAIKKLEASIRELEKSGGEGTITFVMDAPGKSAAAFEMDLEKAKAIVKDMKEKGPG